MGWTRNPGGDGYYWVCYPDGHGEVVQWDGQAHILFPCGTDQFYMIPDFAEDRRVSPESLWWYRLEMPVPPGVTR